MTEYQKAIQYIHERSEKYFISILDEKCIDIEDIDFNTITHNVRSLPNGCTIVNHYMKDDFLFSEAVSIVMNSKSGNIYVFQDFYEDELMWHKLTLP